MSRSALISGLGLMGGSLAAALEQAGWTVYLHHRRPEVVADAVARGFGQCFESAKPDITTIDVVVLGVPVDCVPKQAELWLERGAPLVTDMGSTKAEICSALTPHRDRFIGSHPMCGSHLQGLANAQADLFQGATCVITPTAQTPNERLLRELWETVGSNVVTLGPQQHDELVMQASHLPHILSALTANLLSDDALPLAATGFADTSRVAAGSPDLWTEIITSNRDAVLAGLQQASDQLNELRAQLESNNRDFLKTWFTQAQERRFSFDARTAPPSTAD